MLRNSLLIVAALIAIGWSSSVSVSPASPTSRVFASSGGHRLAKVMLNENLRDCEMTVYRLEQKGEGRLIEEERRAAIAYPTRVLVGDIDDLALIYNVVDRSGVALILHKRGRASGIAITLGQLLTESELQAYGVRYNAPCAQSWSTVRGLILSLSGDELYIDFLGGKALTVNLSTGDVKQRR